MTTPCKECGYPLSGTENACPECGAPTEFETAFSASMSASQSDAISATTDNWDYSQYQRGLFKQWYFPCPDKEMASSYDSLNDILLLFNLVFRMLWSLLWPIALIWITWFIIVTAIGAEIYDPAEAQTVVGAITILFVFGGVHFTFFKLIPRTIHKYWVPLHRTWRRLNKRYWVNMYKAVKSDNIDIV